MRGEELDRQAESRISNSLCEPDQRKLVLLKGKGKPSALRPATFGREASFAVIACEYKKWCVVARIAIVDERKAALRSSSSRGV